MAIVAWLGALGIAASASEADEPMWDFTMAVVLAVIGAALLIVAVLYDIANRVD